MRRRSGILLSVTLSLIVLAGLTGCRAESSSPRLTCIELMQKVPVYYEGFEFWDAEMLRSDPDLSDMYQIWHERRGEWLANFAIDSADIDYVAEAEVLTLAIGSFSLQDVRDSLAEDYARDTAYDLEVWVAKYGGATSNIGGAVALSEGLFVWGNQSNIDDYLSVINGEEPSMYDQNAADLLERMPEGVMLRIFRYSYPEGLIISGDSVEKAEGSTLRWTNVYLFESAEAAADARASEYFTGIEEEFEEANSIFAERGEASPFSDFSLELDGAFIKWSVLLEEEYMIVLLFYG